VQTFGLPLIAKPADDGCSAAVRKIKSAQELQDFMSLIFRNNIDIPEDLAVNLGISPHDEMPLKQELLIEKFIDYDYVGAPWNSMPLAVGNGGFSLRKRSTMLKIIDKLGPIKNINEDGSFKIHRLDLDDGFMAEYEKYLNTIVKLLHSLDHHTFLPFIAMCRERIHNLNFGFHGNIFTVEKDRFSTSSYFSTKRMRCSITYNKNRILFFAQDMKQMPSHPACIHHT
jgi:hypothetical protein